jgi:hypothetical protein
VRVDRSGQELSVYYSPRNWARGIFLTVFLIGWSSGCVMMVGQALAGGGVFMWVFATPFLAAWWFVAWALHQALFTWERLHVGPNGLVHEQRGVLGVSRRKLPLSEVRSLAPALTKGTDEQGPQNYLLIRTVGRPVEFAKGVSDGEVLWLAELLQSHCSVLCGGAEPMGGESPQDEGEEETNAAESDATESDESAAEEKAEVSRIEILEPAERPLEPPSDCRFVLRHGFDGEHFERRGQWSLAGIVGATLINAFWNGIVGVVVWQLVQQFQWFLFFFLIPFELVGLVLITVWVAALFAPAFLNVWSFGGYEIVRRTSFFGLGGSKRYPVTSLDRIELRERAPTPAVNSPQVDLARRLGDFSLSFVTRDEQELVEITGLTEGEARWMADVVYRNFSMWFPRR